MQEATYRCRSCRRLLATASNSMILDDSGRLGDDGSSLFVEPMRYMEDAVLGTISGKLYCPQYALLIYAGDCMYTSRSTARCAAPLPALAPQQTSTCTRLQPVPAGATHHMHSACRCKAKLGSFNWAGMRNCRNEMVTPAFQLHLSRMDRFLPPLPPSSFSEQSQGSPL